MAPQQCGFTIIRTTGRKVLCGNITAIGSPHGAGIGGNKNEDSGSIIINGGFVNAI
jgi:hypothetical protein